MRHPQSCCGTSSRRATTKVAGDALRLGARTLGLELFPPSIARLFRGTKTIVSITVLRRRFNFCFCYSENIDTYCFFLNLQKLQAAAYHLHMKGVFNFMEGNGPCGEAKDFKSHPGSL